MKLALVLALSCGGCLWANPNSYKTVGFDGVGLVADGHGSGGGGVRVSTGGAGVYFAAEATERGVRRGGDPNSYTGLSADLSLRMSLPGVLPTEHTVDRYFDFGLEAGGGGTLAVGVPRTVEGIGEGFVGGWVELGTIPVDDDGYVAISGAIRAYGLDSGWENQTVYTIGLGWRARSRFTQRDLTFRD
jgi:hypothetical protein